jgi:hypothetical protein
MKQIKVINRIPTPADQIEREANKLFSPANLLDKTMPFLLLVAWVGILLAILFS